MTVPAALTGAAAPVRRALGAPVIGPILTWGPAGFAVLMTCRVVFDAPWSIVLDGIALGSLYGLIGAGIILIYRTNRIINFAAAGIGAVPGVFSVLLIVNQGVSWWVAFPLCLTLGAVVGAVLDLLVIRRFAESPRLILTVVTIGVSQGLAFVALYIPRWLTAQGAGFISQIDTPFVDSVFNIGKRPFSYDYPFAVAFSALLVGLLALFFRLTRIGIALRASAENADRAFLLGIPVQRVGTVAWMIAGVFGAAAIFLRSTLVGVPVDGTLGPTVLLYALAAAVVGRMESVSTAMVAGIGIGMLDQASVFKTARSSLAGAVMLVVIVLALLVQRVRIDRAQAADTSTWETVKQFRGVPLELRNLREVVVGRALIGAAVLALFLAAPFLVGDARLSRLAPIPIFAIVAVSMVILTGWAGQISLGQFGLVGIGALVGGGLAANHNVDFFLALLLGIGAGALAAVLIGLPALRVQGLYLAVTTLAFAGAVSGWVINPGYPLGRALLPESGNRIERPVLWERIDLSSERTFYYFCLLFLALALLAARAYRRNRAGRVLIAARDNARAAPSYGINLAGQRLAAFAVSGAIAGTGGVLLAYQQGAIDAASFGIGPSIAIFTVTVVGGLGALSGAVLGAVVIQAINYFSPVDELALLVTGPGLILVLMFLPGGFAEGIYRIRDRYLRRVAERHELVVPSLVADRRVEPGQAERQIVEAAGAHVERVGSFDVVGGPAIVCPVCRAALALEEAAEHEHLRVPAGAGETP